MWNFSISIRRHDEICSTQARQWNFNFLLFALHFYANWFHHIDTRRHSPMPMRSFSRWFMHNSINDVFFFSISSPLSFVVITHRSPNDHGNSVKKCCRKCVAWNVAHLQAHKAREESESRKSANSPAEVPSGDLRVSINLKVDIYIWNECWINMDLNWVERRESVCLEKL